VLHRGSCHCGKIAFHVEGEINEVYDCNCSMCRRRGGLLWFAPRAAFILTSADADVSTYTFNRHALQHHFCANCGISPYSEGVSPDGQASVAINARCIPELDLSALRVRTVDGASF
jgi:hypothetical protein